MSDPNLLAVRSAATAAEERLHARLRALEARVGSLERRPLFPVVAGTPAPGNTTDGTAALDSTQPRLWVQRNGVYVFATLSG